MTQTFRSGFVTIVGRPNVGKSTLMNALVGEKIAIVSNRPQTTRNRVTGILNTEGCQIVFVDTPGMHTPRSKLGELMMQTVQESLSGMDVLLVLLDASHVAGPDIRLAEEMSEKKVRKFLLLTKTDLIEPKNLLPLIDRLRPFSYEEIIPVSAKTGDGLETLKHSLAASLPAGPKYFPDDMITDQPERVLCCEIIREKALRNLRDEVPHGIGVEMLSFTAGENLITVSATIYCERASHKGIIIGKNGAMLKIIGSEARKDIEELLGGHVNLQLWVKVRPDWRNNLSDLKNLGYTE